MRTLLSIALILLVSGVFLGAPVSANAQEVAIQNAGFPDTNIWYSEDPFYAGEEVKIYTLVFNSSDERFSGTVTFYANEQKIGNSSFSITPNGDTETVSVEWEAKEGKHMIRAKVTEAYVGIGQEKESVKLARSETGRDERTVKSPPEPATEKKKTLPLPKASKAVSDIKEAIPPGVATKASQSFSYMETKRRQINSFAKAKNKKIDEQIKQRKEKYELEEETLKENSKNPVSFLSKKHAPFLQLKQMGVSFLEFISRYKFVFYTVLIIVGVWIIKKVFKLLFRRHEY